MLNRYLTSSFLAAAVVALPLTLTGCGDSGTTTPTSTNTPTGGAGERTGRAVDNAVDRTADAANNAANRTGAAVDRAADKTGAAVDRSTSTWNNTTGDRTTANTGSGATTRPSNVPGLPSVTGTSTSDMSTADAAAQRLIDNARENLKQNDVSKAKTLVSELKQDGMYSKLSAQQKAAVDTLERDVNAAPTGTAQETK